MRASRHSEKEQVVRMTRNFFARFFENDLLSPQADFHATLSQALGLLATPGLFVPLLLLPLLMDPDVARSWEIKVIFVFFSMLVMGALCVLEWDALMLDHRDQTILMPLPVRPRTIFAAKFAALAVFLTIFSVDVNAGSILLLPPLEAQGRTAGLLNLVRYGVAHAAGTIGASAFTFLSFVALQGILINICKPKWFRRISTAIQVISVLGILASLFFFPAIVDEMPRWKAESAALIWYFPPMWFVGICEVMQGTADPVFQSLARTGLNGLAIAGVSLTVAYVVAYGRYTRASLEGAVDASRRTADPWRVVRMAAVRRFLRNPLQRATFRFSMQTIFRSSKHRLILSAYVGTGLALVLEESAALGLERGQAWRPAQHVAMLSLPLVISILPAVRHAFHLQYPVRIVLQLGVSSDRTPRKGALSRGSPQMHGGAGCDARCVRGDSGLSLSFRRRNGACPRGLLFTSSADYGGSAVVAPGKTAVYMLLRPRQSTCCRSSDQLLDQLHALYALDGVPGMRDAP